MDGDMILSHARSGQLAKLNQSIIKGKGILQATLENITQYSIQPYRTK